MTKKRCTSCIKQLPMSEFRYTKTKKVFSSECKSCLNARQRRYTKRPEVRARIIKPFGYSCSDDAKSQYDLINFHSSYVIVDECWEWRGGFSSDGYGRVTRKLTKERMRAHRLSYILHFGDFDKSLLVCHKCDNPKCVNPHHLFLGTHKDNLVDASLKDRLKGKTVCVGSEHPNSKLTDDQVASLRRRHAAGESLSSLGREHGVTPQTVYGICHNKSWRHLLPETSLKGGRLRKTGVVRDGSSELEAT